MKNRYNMRAKTGEYVESIKKKTLVDLRKKDPRFKFSKINSAIQALDKEVVCGVIYPNYVFNRTDFLQFNKTIILANTRS